MKLLKITGIGICLLPFMAATAQEKNKNQKTKVTQPTVVTPQEPDEAFKKRNKDVKSIDWYQGKTIIIKKTDGTVEKYRLDNKEEEGKAISLYGPLPTVPPPPPPVPAIPPPPPPTPVVEE